MGGIEDQSSRTVAGPFPPPQSTHDVATPSVCWYQKRTPPCWHVPGLCGLAMPALQPAAIVRPSPESATTQPVVASQLALAPVCAAISVVPLKVDQAAGDGDAACVKTTGPEARPFPVFEKPTPETHVRPSSEMDTDEPKKSLEPGAVAPAEFAA